MLAIKFEAAVANVVDGALNDELAAAVGTETEDHALRLPVPALFRKRSICYIILYVCFFNRFAFEGRFQHSQFFV